MDNILKETLLPLVAPSIAPGQPTTSPSEAAATLGLSHVIIAVADSTTREQLAELWRQEGYSVSTMTCGMNVLELLADSLLSQRYIDATPALIILDERLAGVLGSTIASGVRELGWTTPIVLLGEGKCHRDTWTVVLPVNAAPHLVFRSSKALARAK